MHGTKRDAEAKLRELLTSAERGAYVAPSKLSVGDFLVRWLVSYAATATSARTQQDYRSIVNRYLIPALGSMPLTSIRPEHVQQLYAALKDRGLSAMTILHTHRLFKQALSHAVKWDLAARNVCDLVDPPRPQRTEMTALDTEGVSRLRAAAIDTPFVDVFLVALYSGLRRSEVLALRWPEVDIERGTLRVVAGLHRINGKGLALLPTKTARSRRQVSITQDVADVLRQIRGYQMVQRMELGELWQNSGFVFTDQLGNPLDPNRVSKAFAKLRTQAALKGLRFHDLRHTHASLMLSAGVHPKVVSERLGHASIAITMDTYSHVLPGIQEEAAERFSRLLAEPHQT